MEQIMEIQFHHSKPFIKSITFPQNGDSLLKGCSPIECISQECTIITGLNGSGKSLLLDYIYENLEKKEKRNFAYIKSNKEGFSAGRNIFSLEELNQVASSLLSEKSSNNSTLSKLNQFQEHVRKIIKENKSKYSDLESIKKLCHKVNDIFTLIYNFEHGRDIINYFKNKYSQNSLKNIAEKINDILKEINYPYLFNDSMMLRIDTDNDTEIEMDKLSSGETIIISLVLWYAVVEDLRDSKEPSEHYEINIILFDEVDKHLDPKQCKIFTELISKFSKKLNVQIFLSSHRFDTLALAPSEHIYYASKDCSKFMFEEKTKLEVLKELTGNLLELTNLHSRVYVEGAGTDMKFYSKIYEKLKAQRKKILEDVKNGIITEKTNVHNDIINNAPTNKHEMFFYSAKDKNQVIGSIERDVLAVENLNNWITNYNNKLEEDENKNKRINLLTSLNSFKSLGIVDMDHEKENTGDGNNHENLLVLKRYCIDNFLIDPFIFNSSVYTKIDFKKWKKRDEFSRFLEICKKINQKISNLDLKTDQTKLQQDLDEYFDFILDVCAKYYNTNLSEKEPLKTKFLDIVKEFKDLDKTDDSNFKDLRKCLKDISEYKKKKNISDILDDYKKNKNDDQNKKEIPILTECGHTIQFKYPKQFFYLSGKEIRKSLNIELRSVLEKFEVQLIPWDIVETIFELKKKSK